jgi:hypothetical protein
MIGTAMGTSFSVVYAIIVNIWLGTPIINDIRFSRFIQVYKRFLDDLFLIWSGPPDLLCEFRKALAEANEGIGFDWSGCKDQQDSINPSLVAIQQHDQVNFLDSDISLSRNVTKTGTKIELYFAHTKSLEIPTPTYPLLLSMAGIFSEAGCKPKY